MPAANLGPKHDLAKRISDLESAVQQLSTRDVLKNASIGSDGLIVYGGSIQILGGGSLIVSGTLSVPTGSLNTGGNLSAGGTITAGTSMSAGTTVHAGTDLTATGNVTATNITASGQSYSAAAFKSPGSYGYHVTTGYQAMWINNDGTIGISASTRASKKDTIPLTDLAPLMKLRPVLGRYIWDEEGTPLKQFLIAEDVAEAGFGPDVVPEDEQGKPLSVNYSQLVPALIAKVQELSARLSAAGL